CYFCFSKVPNGGNLDVDRTLNSPTARILHTSVVFESIAEKRISRYGHNRLVKILDFNVVEIDFQHITVCSVFAHFNPIADPDGIIGGYLYTCYKTENSVFKYQH